MGRISRQTTLTASAFLRAACLAVRAVGAHGLGDLVLKHAASDIEQEKVHGLDLILVILAQRPATSTPLDMGSDHTLNTGLPTRARALNRNKAYTCRRTAHGRQSVAADRCLHAAPTSPITAPKHNIQRLVHSLGAQDPPVRHIVLDEVVHGDGRRIRGARARRAAQEAAAVGVVCKRWAQSEEAQSGRGAY